MRSSIEISVYSEGRCMATRLQCDCKNNEDDNLKKKIVFGKLHKICNYKISTQPIVTNLCA